MFCGHKVTFAAILLSGLASPAADAARLIRAFRPLTPVLTGLIVLGFARASHGEARAEPAGGIQVDERIDIGFRGAYKVGEWTRLRLWVQTAAPQELSVVVECPDADDDRAVLPSRTFTINPGPIQPVETCF